ncbi:MAG TPA: serine/threonine-protein kinase [Urbifossiella sp.]|nr:serine/threonine-protein kinase [Urbifossiella sp.]
MIPAQEEFEERFRQAQAALERDPAADLGSVYETTRGWPDDERSKFLYEVLAAQLIRCVYTDCPIRPEDYLTRFPELRKRPDLRERLLAARMQAELTRFNRAAGAAARVAGPDAPPALAHFDPGQWNLEGSGGEGSVWRGWNTNLGRHEAVKILRGSRGARGAAEAHSLAGIAHPNVCQVYGYEVGWDNRPALRMQFVDGVTADKWAAGAIVRDPRRVAALLAAVADGLAAVHARSIVHCDLKPVNVRVTDDGKPIIVDFGLARRLGSTTGEALGTKRYMSPEQHAGGTVDPRWDVYALGISLLELTTAARAPEPPALPADRAFDPDLVGIVRMATAKDPHDRYESVGQMAEDLKRYATGRGEELRARPHGWFRRTKGWVWANAALLTVILAAVTAAVGGWSAVERYLADRLRTERDTLVARLDARWAKPVLSPGDQTTAEADIDRLEVLDPDNATHHRVRYVDVLLGAREIDLGRLKGVIERLEVVGEPGLARLRSPVRALFFHQQVAPEHQFDVLAFFLRPDPDRIPRLEQTARIQDVFGPTPGRPGARLTLARAYLTAEQQDAAAGQCTTLLNRTDLLPAWEVVVFRDAVWAAVSSRDEHRRRDMLGRLNTDRYRGTDGRFRPEFAELNVELARLLNADGRPAEAAGVLDEYLASVDRLELLPESPRTLNNRHRDGPARVNVATMWYLDTAMLRGFLPGGKESVWEDAFKRVSLLPTGASYEAAILGSLSGELKAADAAVMMVTSAETAGVFGPAVVEMRAAVSDPAALKTATEVVRNAWRSPRGRELARRIATRELPFHEFLHAQIRLWLYEGLRLLTRGSGAELSRDEDVVLWAVAENLREDWARGALSEDAAVRVLTFARGPGLISPGQWPSVAQGLPPRLRGPLAYVLGRVYQTQVPVAGQWVAGAYFAYARDHAALAPHPEELRRLVELGKKVER